MRAPSHFPGHENITRLVSHWHYQYLGSACPQSHLKRMLGLDGGHLRLLLDYLVDAGDLRFVESPYAGEPDVALDRLEAEPIDEDGAIARIRAEIGKMQVPE